MTAPVSFYCFVDGSYEIHWIQRNGAIVATVPLEAPESLVAVCARCGSTEVTRDTEQEHPGVGNCRACGSCFIEDVRISVVNQQKLVKAVAALDPAAGDHAPSGAWDAAKWNVFNAAVRFVKERA